MMTRRFLWAAGMALAVAMGLSSARIGAQTTRSTRDGVFTVAQAKRGQAAYSEICLECHGRDLLGDVENRPLVGYQFIGNWDGSTMLTLFDRVRISMPADKPGTLSRDKVADILAFVLAANDFPAGSAELSTRGELLQQIRFETPKQQ